MKDNSKQIIHIRFSEISLKGKNQSFFQKQLFQNIKTKLKKLNPKITSQNFHDHIEIFSLPNQEIISILQKIPGIEIIVPTYFFPLTNIDDLQKNVIAAISEENFDTFRITAKRNNKEFPQNSLEIQKILGGEVLKNLPQKQVDLHKPDLNIHIDINQSEFLIFFEKIKGVGGLPVPTSGKAITLLSCGFDSPIASFKILKRGMSSDFIHFHNYPQTPKASLENAQKIASLLNQYQNQSQLFLIPFLEIQKYLSLNIDSEYLVVFYRRIMMKITNIIAKKHNIQAIITGDNLGQVASQTIENLTIANEASTIPILRPLIGENKSDIIELSKKLGLYEISAEPVEDCCTAFIPKHPKTKTKLEEVTTIEKDLELEPLIKKAIDQAEIKEIK